MITQSAPSMLMHILAFTSRTPLTIRGFGRRSSRMSRFYTIAQYGSLQAAATDWYDDPLWLRAPKQQPQDTAC